MMRNSYTVVVGNIGIVYDGNNGRVATRIWECYKTYSLCGSGRAAGETVTLITNGEITREHIGTQAA